MLTQACAFLKGSLKLIQAYIVHEAIILAEQTMLD
uniref:Uncharacterized protein n=1 Tax=Anguilla anguilla TaxID=7936 RepID=A0A0E9SI70_ANGAN